MALTRLMFEYRHHEEYVYCSNIGSLTRLQSGPYFKLEKRKTDKLKNNVSYRGRSEWNNFPAYIHCIELYPKFKKEVKLLYNHHYFSTIEDV